MFLKENFHIYIGTVLRTVMAAGSINGLERLLQSAPFTEYRHFFTVARSSLINPVNDLTYAILYWISG